MSCIKYEQIEQAILVKGMILCRNQVGFICREITKTCHLPSRVDYAHKSRSLTSLIEVYLIITCVLETVWNIKCNCITHMYWSVSYLDFQGEELDTSDTHIIQFQLTQQQNFLTPSTLGAGGQQGNRQLVTNSGH